MYIDHEKEDNHRPFNSFEIGFLTKQKVIQLRNDGYDRKLNYFFLGVLSSFKVAVSYAKRTFHLMIHYYKTHPSWILEWEKPDVRCAEPSN